MHETSISTILEGMMEAAEAPHCKLEPVLAALDELFEKIDDLVWQHDISYIDAIVQYCEECGKDVEDIGKAVKHHPRFREVLEAEATSLNALVTKERAERRREAVRAAESVQEADAAALREVNDRARSLYANNDYAARMKAAQARRKAEKAAEKARRREEKQRIARLEKQRTDELRKLRVEKQAKRKRGSSVNISP